MTLFLPIDRIWLSKCYPWRCPKAEASLLIKKMPSDVKDWLASEVQRNHRSMSKGTISAC